MSNRSGTSLLLWAGLLRASHPGPTAAVTALVAVLASVLGHDAATITLIAAAVLTGQLSIGWSNDLVDAPRDRRAGRRDKPIATGELPGHVVRVALAVTVPTCVALSLLCGLRSGLSHLLLGVASGWLYNLWLKRTAWSWLPYAVAFGSLPAWVTLALPQPVGPPVWMVAAAALLGVGAHLVNALPDLDEDAATGVRGLPHRLGPRGASVVAAAVLTAASVVTVTGPAGPAPTWAWVVLGCAVALAVLGSRGTGRTPFRATIAIAFLDVAMLALRG
ncbi:MAG: UbiA family prenyltransferase [Actinomycetota bacterium]|nr:UbiA family prenyltransferase [Actinomycetota bacterium]